jgi:O-6-methylguanine DNA methyltransferase
MISFTERVYAATRKISKGQTRTYKEIARAAGKPRAWRAVGNILNKNRDARVPCHRVIRSDGTAGGYARGTRAKMKRLAAEGVYVKP